jgi:hypothetical protein
MLHLVGKFRLAYIYKLTKVCDCGGRYLPHDDVVASTYITPHTLICLVPLLAPIPDTQLAFSIIGQFAIDFDEVAFLILTLTMPNATGA